METVSEAIKARRSVRSFERKDVPEDFIKQLMQAAFCGPSANNARPWHIVVVRDQATKAKLADTHLYSGFISGAPVVLVVCADKKLSPEYWIEDCSIASQNLLLAAHGLGLGTCWVAVRQGASERYEDYVRKALELPENFRVLCFIPLGYPAEEPLPRAAVVPPRRIHRDKFGEHLKSENKTP